MSVDASAGPGGAIPAARRAARPDSLMRSLVHGTSKVAVTVTGRPKVARRVAMDALISSSAGQPTNVGRISTLIEPSAGATSTRWMIPRSTTDSIGSSGSGTSARAARMAASRAAEARPRTIPARARAIPIWVPASLTRSLPGPIGGPS